MSKKRTFVLGILTGMEVIAVINLVKKIVCCCRVIRKTRGIEYVVGINATKEDDRTVVYIF